MADHILMEVVRLLALFFLNPLFLIALIVTVMLGYFRVKRERRSFKVRLLPGLTEFKRLLTESWLYGLVLSVLIVGVGLTVDIGWLVLFCVVSFISVLSFYYKLMSPIYFVAMSFLLLFVMKTYVGDFTYRGWSASSIELFGELSITVPVIAGLLLIAEGLLVRRFGARDASPTLTHTNRGLRAAVFTSKRLWLLPIIFIVPGDVVTAYMPYWPQFTFGKEAFTFIPIPLLVGFSQVARATNVQILLPKVGRDIAVLGIFVLAIAVGAIWLPILGIAALISGVVGRVMISILVAVRERRGGFFAAPSSTGIVIAGVLADSPSEKMGLLPGESIRSVNGQIVSNEKDLYSAIQINAAHCRLQVLGHDGEVRLVQQVIYRHDHHRLGLLIVG